MQLRYVALRGKSLLQPVRVATSADGIDAATAQAYPTPHVQSRPLAPAGVPAYSRPIAAQPLPPVGSVGTMPAVRSPQPGYSVSQNAGSSLNTGSVSSPRVSGFASKGWSAEGGTTIIAGNGDTVATLSNRYGVPAEAILPPTA